MCAGERPKYQDQHDQNASGRDGVAKERQRDVTPGQLLRHDARADHRRQQEGGAQPFGEDAPSQ
jgi:hypothetical protein